MVAAVAILVIIVKEGENAFYVQKTLTVPTEISDIFVDWDKHRQLVQVFVNRKVSTEIT